MRPAEIRIPTPLVASAGVPDVCVRHGQPASTRKRLVLNSRPPAWVYPLAVWGSCLSSRSW